MRASGVILYARIPEAARVLRPGQLIFLVNSVQIVRTWPDQDDLPATETLQRPCFGMQRSQWLGSDSVEFHNGHSEMIRLPGRCGFGICDPHRSPDPAGLNQQESGRDLGMGAEMALRRSPQSPQIALTRRA